MEGSAFLWCTESAAEGCQLRVDNHLSSCSFHPHDDRVVLGGSAGRCLCEVLRQPVRERRRRALTRRHRGSVRWNRCVCGPGCGGLRPAPRTWKSNGGSMAQVVEPGTGQVHLPTTRIGRSPQALCTLFCQTAAAALALWACSGGAHWRSQPHGFQVSRGAGLAVVVWAVLLVVLLVRLVRPIALVLSAEGLELRGGTRRTRLRWAEVEGLCLLPAPRRTSVTGREFFRGKPLVRASRGHRPRGAGTVLPPAWVEERRGIVLDLRYLAVTSRSLDDLCRRYAGERWHGAATMPCGRAEAVNVPGRLISRPAAVLLRGRAALSSASAVLAWVLGGGGATTAGAVTALSWGTDVFAAVTFLITCLSPLCRLRIDAEAIRLTLDGGLHVLARDAVSGAEVGPAAAPPAGPRASVRRRVEGRGPGRRWCR
ncbi:hypothetical protein [Streptomyces sp. NPDC051636]|uniref:hypothetical protein n=1 Tax=Streptomyces sp. NPDC051636 TaxID=3365663 RepID=UPI0037B11B08